MRTAVIGLGKLGCPLAAVLADAGHEVVGADVSPRTVHLVNDGVAPVVETGLQGLLNACRSRLRATTDIGEAVRAAQITFVIVPTPSGEDGRFVLDSVLPAVREIGNALRESRGRHVVVITSTVMPGATGGPIREVLESASGLMVGADVGLCYSPEFIALGSVIRDMTYPDLVLVGESDPESGELLANVMRQVVKSSAPIRHMNFINAEVAKISINTYVTTKISFANMLAEICERLPGGDAGVVTDAMGLDKRIGSTYLRGATPYGGPCFPRDNVAFSKVAEAIGVQADIVEATDRINRRQVPRLVKIVIDRMGGRAGRCAVLGLAYKPHTPVTDESTGVALARALSGLGWAVTVFDPVVGDAAAGLFDPDVKVCKSVEQCVAHVDAVVLPTGSRDFSSLPWALRASGVRPLVVDCWRSLSGDELLPVADVAYVGEYRGDLGSA